jgi:hypothetical protein
MIETWKLRFLHSLQVDGKSVTLYRSTGSACCVCVWDKAVVSSHHESLQSGGIPPGSYSALVYSHVSPRQLQALMQADANGHKMEALLRDMRERSRRHWIVYLNEDSAKSGPIRPATIGDLRKKGYL